MLIGCTQTITKRMTCFFFPNAKVWTCDEIFLIVSCDVSIFPFTYRCVRSMGNVCVLTAAVVKVWTAPLGLGKAPPLVLQDVTLQGHRWQDSFHVLLVLLVFPFSTLLTHIIVFLTIQTDAYSVIDYRWILKNIMCMFSNNSVCRQ